MKKESKMLIVYSVVIVISCVVIVTMIFFLSITSPIYTPYTYPTADLTIEKVDDNYILYINSCFDPDKISRLKDVNVYLHNESGVIAGYLLIDILNDESSNITFYDHDNNGRLSVGDDFIIDGDLIGPGSRFRLTYKPYATEITNLALT